MTGLEAGGGGLRAPERELPRTLVIRQPRDGSPVGEMPVTPPGRVAGVVDAVRPVQAGWASLDPRDRSRRMAGLRREIHRRSEEIVDRIVAETGKPEVEALMEILVVQSLLRFYERRAPRILRRRRVGTGWLLSKQAWTLREPYGVVGVIAPWNYPFVLVMEPTLTALFGGNGVVAKPSELAPFTGALVSELVEGGGLPGGLVRVVQGPEDTGKALVRGGVDKIRFSGSSEAGRDVLAAAAPRLVPVALELGGKDPALVLEDADLDRAARGIVFGAFFNAGQTCLATERAYVVQEVHDAFVRRVKRLVSDLRVGSGGRVDVGPMTSRARLALVEDQVREAVEEGARVVCGGERADPASNVLLPTVLVDVTPGMRVAREETFGPVLPILRVRDEEEALVRANDHPSGLFASVWTGDPDRGRAVASRLRTGGASINDTLSHWAVPGLPVGGTGESGYSRGRGAEGLMEMTRSRSFLRHRGFASRDPWWFPYRPLTVRLLRTLLGWEGGGGAGRVREALRGFSRGEG